MTRLKLTQSWVDQVTSDPSDDVIVSGGDLGQAPSAAALSAILKNAARSDAVKEMVRRKWLAPTAGNDRQAAHCKALQEFLFAQRPNRPSFALAAMWRRKPRERNFVDEITILAWLYRVIDRATAMPKLQFDVAKLNEKAIEHLVRLSARGSGPRDGIGYLQELGIRIVIESSLPGMHTDGASLIVPKLGPVIGLTLRHDRLDNFWFTLLHELAHIALHLRAGSDEVFIDSIEDDDRTESEIESEANAYAKDSFVPRDDWLRSEAFRFGTEPGILALAKKYKIHPAVVAGRLRFERRKYQRLSQLVGAGQVRSLLMSD